MTMVANVKNIISPIDSTSISVNLTGKLETILVFLFKYVSNRKILYEDVIFDVLTSW